MIGRTLAIGDIHGCATALEALLEVIQPQPDDVVVALGDIIDRGPRTRQTLDRLLSLQEQCRLVPLLGNHEEMLLAVLGGASPYQWVNLGGAATLDSYGFAGSLDVIPTRHREFLQSCRPYYETATHFFIHANYHPYVPLNRQPRETARWQALTDDLPEPHCSGKIAVVGHTPQRNGEVLWLEHLWCIDTYCYGDGWLTGLDVLAGEVWQANEQGDVRHRSYPAVARAGGS
jgi:serine/threonine protein phosphatase 1